MTHMPADIETLPGDLRDIAAGIWNDLVAIPELDKLATFDASLLPCAGRVLASSQFIARWITAHPAAFCQLVEAGELTRQLDTPDVTERVVDALADACDDDTIMRAVRQLRQREWVRLAWRDLAGIAELDEVTHTLSDFADACMQQTLLRLCDLDDLDMTGFIVLGMGKLGGRELNFSSDIDIIFALEGDEEPSRNVIRMAQRLGRLLDQPTADGFAFRVDTRLRPHGSAGPVVFSTTAMEHYYQTHGRSWERYALVKARACAGDIAAGQALIESLRPFVYRKYLDFGAFEAIRDMHAMIRSELVRKNIDNDIKRGRGGIRQIEFVAQSQQLIRGGREPQLRTEKLRSAIDAMISLGEFDKATADSLYADYVFLRRIEHRLQMYADMQTHSLPAVDDMLAWQRLAFSTGFDDVDAFSEALEATRARVDEIFKGTFRIEDEEVDAPRSNPWLDLDMEVDVAATLETLGYDDTEDSARRLEAFHAGALVQSLSTEGRGRLDAIMPMLIEGSAQNATPSATLGRVIRLLESIGRRPTYFAAMAEFPAAREQVVALCAASPWLAQWLGTHPLLLDELLSPVSDDAVSREELEETANNMIRDIDDSDTENLMERLREFRNSQAFRIATRQLRHGTSARATARELTLVAEVVIDIVYRIALTDLAHRLPDSIKQSPKLCVIAYGKLGSFELGFMSDIDIVFLYDDDGEFDHEQQSGYARIAQRMISFLTTRLASGLLYEVDVRLRPSGNKGLLVSSLEAFSRYQTENAWTFEHQALVRARALTGNASVAARFEAIRTDILCQPRESTTLVKDIVEMRERMIDANDQSTPDALDLKLGHGALVDIEFIAQYGTLSLAMNNPALLESTDTEGVLRRVADAGGITADECDQLVSALEYFLTTIDSLRLREAAALDGSKSTRKHASAVRSVWNRLFVVSD